MEGRKRERGREGGRERGREGKKREERAPHLHVINITPSDLSWQVEDSILTKPSGAAVVHWGREEGGEEGGEEGWRDS